MVGAGYSNSGKTMRPKQTPLWRINDAKAMKAGQRGTIYWVGKSIIGEDGAATGARSKGASYHGEWQGDKKTGYGVQVYPNGDKYEGQWGNGVRDGEGTLWVPTGKAGKLRKLYVGGWKDDHRHGRGTCFFKNGEFFQGSWDDGKMHGRGTLRYSNGDLYIGEWHDGLRSGQGTLNRANGDCYEGYWLEDKREGSGSYFYAESGKVFVGDWANDLPKAGVYTQANPNPEQATAVPTTSVLPPVRLAFPAEVLEGALAAVRNARKSFRAQATPLSRLFSEDEIVALRNAFDAAEKSSGSVRMPELRSLCAHLGSEVQTSRLRRLLIEAMGSRWGVEAASNEDGVRVEFEDFLRVVALLLDEEAEMHAGDSFGETISDHGLTGFEAPSSFAEGVSG
eukprot:TRINITY_DN20980_c0_g1_i1.p1 TRINITY_DN20980_c0_g1~~TRINITY_DN20980_c0_g1_i1.p1  ORF type:complete len:459 (+),score=82.14 TRINITY_DN20980_c0_g1_i1:198-1379(+)